MKQQIKAEDLQIGDWYTHNDLFIYMKTKHLSDKSSYSIECVCVVDHNELVYRNNKQYTSNNSLVFLVNDHPLNKRNIWNTQLKELLNET